MSIEIDSRRRGADGMSFDTIVASGFRGALPHGVASEKKIRAGELVVVDWGVNLGGYMSDETQTVAVGSAGQKEREIYDLVKRAHDAAIESIRPGASLGEADRIARSMISDAGYGKYFGHNLGHGVGLQIHEDPRVATQSNELMEAGMVFTVEPGIYLPGWGGVRIESMVLVTPTGGRVMTILDKDLKIL